jgi:ATP phosphoribosyltransferase regulatory subunit
MRDLFPQQARLRRRLEDQLIHFFEHRGFELVSSGAFEYADTLLRGRTRGASEDWVQVFDRSGRPMALRPDMTPSIARMAAPLVAAGHTPIRWCYAERVYHRSDAPASLSWLSGRAAESTQVGVEWIGEGGVAVDSQLLALCQAAVSELGLADCQMVLGHALLVPALLRALGAPEAVVESLLLRLNAGDYVAFRQEAGAYTEERDVLTLLSSLNPFRPRSLPDDLLHGGAPELVQVRAAWDELCRLAEELERSGLADEITFDLTLHRDPAYYTGIVFEVFAPGVGAPIAQGGRYDRLLAEFGAEAPAIGFTFEIERLMSLSEMSGQSVLKGGVGTC